MCVFGLFFASRRRHTSCALVTGVQTCALPICGAGFHAALPADLAACVKQRLGKARLARATRPDERNDPHCAAFSFHDCISSSARRSPHSYGRRRSEEHTSELQSLMRISYAVFCLKKKNEYRERSHLTERNVIACE